MAEETKKEEEVFEPWKKGHVTVRDAIAYRARIDKKNKEKMKATRQTKAASK